MSVNSFREEIWGTISDPEQMTQHGFKAQLARKTGWVYLFFFFWSKVFFYFLLSLLGFILFLKLFYLFSLMKSTCTITLGKTQEYILENQHVSIVHLVHYWNEIMEGPADHTNRNGPEPNPTVPSSMFCLTLVLS